MILVLPRGTSPDDESTGEGYVVFSYNTTFEAFVQEKRNAKLMTWHKSDRKQDHMLRHPEDGSQWRKIDRKYKDFAREARNIRFGLGIDGFNPFGEFSSGHSTWCRCFRPATY
jgi:hypothetical protein